MNEGRKEGYDEEEASCPLCEGQYDEARPDDRYQQRELEDIAERSGWEIVATFSDQTSGAKDKRPGLDALIKEATARKFDMVAAWSMDRLGRSLQHLVNLLADFKSLGVDVYLHQQHVDFLHAER